ncbi:MAG: NUDIX hydrolase [Chloroflexota bacterium]
MNPSPLLSTLEAYLSLYPDEANTVNRVRDLIQAYPNAFERSCQIGHITGSAWIVSADRQRCLLTHHRKLNRWLQLGGHVDGEQQVDRAALREAQEESGLTDFTFVEIANQVIPFDIDIHPIPATLREPAHEHFDLRYLLIANDKKPLKISQESKDLRWFRWEEINNVADEVSIHRMIGKAKHYLGDDDVQA